jgi:hypothetical protein
MANPPWFKRNRQEFAQNPENNSEGLCEEKRAEMCILGGLLFMRGLVPSFLFVVSVAASQKKPDFDTPKMENTLFMRRNENQHSWSSSPSQGPYAYPIWPCFDKSAPLARSTLDRQTRLFLAAASAFIADHMAEAYVRATSRSVVSRHLRFELRVFIVPCIGRKWAC